MTKEEKLKLAKQHYLTNKEVYEKFTKNFSRWYIPYKFLYRILNNYIIDFDINLINISSYYKFPLTINVNILNIINHCFIISDNLSNEFIDNFIKSAIIETIIHEKLHSIQFRPIRFVNKKNISSNQKVIDYYDNPVRAETYKCIIADLEEISKEYKVDKEILKMYITNSYSNFHAKNKKFRKYSKYNYFKYILYSHTDFRISKEVELDIFGKNYYNSTIRLSINNKRFYVKRGSDWNLAELHKYLCNEKVKDITIEVLENFNKDDFREFLQNNYPLYETRLYNSIRRSGYYYGTINELKECIMEDKHIRGVGNKSLEILKDYLNLV